MDLDDCANDTEEEQGGASGFKDCYIGFEVNDISSSDDEPVEAEVGKLNEGALNEVRGNEAVETEVDVTLRRSPRLLDKGLDVGQT